MAEPFLGELRMMSFNFPRKGWALVNGQLLPINQNQAPYPLRDARRAQLLESTARRRSPPS